MTINLTTTDNRLTRDADHATDDSLAVDALVTSVDVYEEA
jgi:hypothetical protein